jgi:glycosyltransferase involved in cell wall biosynthesis
MRICIFTPIFPPEIGGPATYSVRLAKLINKGKRHSAFILTLAPEHPKKRFGLEVYSVLRKGSVVERELRLLKSIVEGEKRADVIYGLDVAAIGSQAILAGKLLNKPVVIRYVGDTAWEKAQREGKTKKVLHDFLAQPDANQYLIQIQKLVLNNAKAIIVASKYLKNILVRYYDLPEGKVHVVPNAVEEEAFKIKKARKPEGTVRIVTVARFVPWKRIDNILRAVATAKKKTKLHLKIIGSGPLESELKRLANNLGLNREVTFTGAMSRKATLSEIANSDIFILNSEYEGMAHTILEAMACRTPVIASNIEPNQEVIKGGFSGILVRTGPSNVAELSSAVLRLASNKQLQAKLAKNALGEIKKYTWDRTSKGAISVLERAGEKQ